MTTPSNAPDVVACGPPLSFGLGLNLCPVCKSPSKRGLQPTAPLVSGGYQIGTVMFSALPQGGYEVQAYTWPAGLHGMIPIEDCEPLWHAFVDSSGTVTRVIEREEEQ